MYHNLCYSCSVASSTSSFRIPNDLKARLESTAKQMKKRKNWIINQALKEYLTRHNRELFLAEARRQSIAASKIKWKDERFWDKIAAEAWNDE